MYDKSITISLQCSEIMSSASTGSSANAASSCLLAHHAPTPRACKRKTDLQTLADGNDSPAMASRAQYRDAAAHTNLPLVACRFSKKSRMSSHQIVAAPVTTAKPQKKTPQAWYPNTHWPPHQDVAAPGPAPVHRFGRQVGKDIALSELLPTTLSEAQSTALQELFKVNTTELHPLHIAAALGDSLEELRLLSQGASGESKIDVTTGSGLTPLMTALINPVGAAKTVRHLLCLKADPQKKNIHGLNALHIAARWRDNPAALTPLIEAGLSPFETTKFNTSLLGPMTIDSPLYKASASGHIGNVLHMLSLASPGEGHATTALLASHAGGHYHLCQVLCEKFPCLEQLPAVPLCDETGC